MDDMIDTAGTLVKAAEVLKERGAKSVYAYCTHPVFSGPALERIKNSALDEVVITNTIPLADGAKSIKNIRQLSVAFLFAETIRRISDGESVLRFLGTEQQLLIRASCGREVQHSGASERPFSALVADLAVEMNGIRRILSAACRAPERAAACARRRRCQASYSR
jgi:hypothetical protein